MNRVKRWEYKVIDFYTTGFGGGKIEASEIETKLNALGNQGWEVVSGYATAQSSGVTRKIIYTLKRELDERQMF